MTMTYKDLMFQLTQDEERRLRSQIVTLKKGQEQHTMYPAYAFTQQNIVILSGALNSNRTIAANSRL